MKFILAGILAAASLHAALIVPTQAMLDAGLIRAELAWGVHADVASIKLVYLNDCPSGGHSLAGWTWLVTSDIEINSACRWDAELLDIAIAHEYGHVLLRTSAHSLDKHSVMYFKLAHGQKILPDDFEWLRETQERIRPTILTPQ